MMPRRVMKTYLTLKSSNKHALENLTCLVTVAYILESLGCVLTANIEHDFFTTTVYT